MDEIIERLARECADSLVRQRSASLGAMPPLDHGVTVGTDAASVTAWHGSERRATDVASAVRGEIHAALAAALRRLRDEMNAGPLPSPVAAARLAQIARAHADGRPKLRTLGAFRRTLEPLHAAIGELLAHADHLERLVRLLAQESECQAFAAGLAEGGRLARAEMLAAIQARVASLGAHPDRAAVAFHLGTLAAALVTDAEGVKS